jgi:hypothetical protein
MSAVAGRERFPAQPSAGTKASCGVMACWIWISLLT